MGSRRQTGRSAASESYGRVLLRRLACLLTATSLLPVLLFGPLGPGVIVIHDHHEEDLHAHKVYPGVGGQGAPTQGHDHPEGTAVDTEGAQFVLTLPDLPRAVTQVQVSSPQVKLSSPSVVVAAIISQDADSHAFDLGAGKHPAGTLRAHDKIAGLLLTGHSLLI